MADLTNVQKVQVVNTAYEGLDLEGLDIINRSAHAPAPTPPVGTRVLLASYQVPAHLVWAIDGLTYYCIFPVGGNYVEVPDDFARESLVFRVLRNDASVWNSVVRDVAGNSYDGTDLLNIDVLDQLGEGFGHIIVAENSVLKFEAEIINAAFVPPAGLRCGFRFSGREIQKDKWEDVAL